MRVARFVVCLLALAGSLAPFATRRGSKSARIPAKIPAQAGAATTRAIAAARSVPVRAAGGEAFAPARFPNNGAALLPPARARASISVPMTFEPNVGQAAADVKFIGRGKGMNVWLTQQGFALQVAGANRHGSTSNSGAQGVVTLRIAGAQPFDWKAARELPGKSNYFLGNDPRKWRTNVPHFERVEAAKAATVGIAVYGSDEGVEYDLKASPRANVSKLRMTLAGASDLRIDSNGDLLMNVSDGTVRMKKPRVYQKPRSGWHGSGTKRKRSLGARRAKKYSPRHATRAGSLRQGSAGKARKHAENPCSRKPGGLPGNSKSGGVPCPAKAGSPAKIPADARGREIDAGYILEADGSIGFRIGPHDPGATLVIDPSLSVSYATLSRGIWNRFSGQHCGRQHGQYLCGRNNRFHQFSYRKSPAARPCRRPQPVFCGEDRSHANGCGFPDLSGFPGRRRVSARWRNCGGRFG
jgi:hypothetical protein